jgi:hypothetical protein
MTYLTGSGGITDIPPEVSRWQRYRLENPDKVKEYERQRRSGQSGNSRNEYKRNHYRVSNPTKPFAGVDGEGRDDPTTGHHNYFMLRAGDETLSPRDGEGRLRTSDVLDFLSNLSQDYTYVSYFFDYDVTKILEDLSWKKYEKLIRRDKRKMRRGGWFPVDYGDYEFDWFPRKEFKVRKKGGPWTVIHDVGTFFQTSFIKTIETWDCGTPYVREKIAEGKGLRGEFVNIDNEYVDQYNKWECECLVELMEKFRKVCYDLDYRPKKWQGPGLIAEAAMQRHGVPKTVDIPILNGEEAAKDDSIASFGRYAYYGPKFETSVVGPTPKPCVQFDINSAFPAAMQFLPCLIHGEWERVTGNRSITDDELSICFGTFKWNAKGKRFMFGGFPVRRSDGSIHFPANGKGWYWSFEARSSIHQDFVSHDSWIYSKKCDCRPFSYLDDIYRERKRLGKGTVGIVLKLVMNSHYGKLVQTIGDPQYSNPIWASFITAYTRTQIADAIHSLPCCLSPDNRIPCGYDVYMIASDAIYTRKYESFTLDIGGSLGQWDMAVHDNGLFIVQPGVYFDPVADDSEGTYKTRGVPKRMVVEHRDAFISGYARIVETRDVRSGDVLLPFRVFVGIRQAIARHSTKQLGLFIPYVDKETQLEGRRTSFEWTTKRRPQPLPEYYDATRGIRTAPYDGLTRSRYRPKPIQTIPYSKDIGGIGRRELERMAFDNQPDWVRTQ